MVFINRWWVFVIDGNISIGFDIFYCVIKWSTGLQIKKEVVKNKILESAKKEFLKHGFQSASLRTIAKRSGLSKGAFYTYFSNKEAIFTELVKEPAEKLYQYIKAMQAQALSQDIASQIDYANAKDPKQDDFWINYMYEHIDSFKLIALHSKGTQYQDYFNRLVELEKTSTLSYLRNMRKANALYYDPDDMLVHILTDIAIRSLICILENDIPREKGLHYWQKMEVFYFAGWKKLLFNI